MRRLVVLAPSIRNNTSQFDPLLSQLQQDPRWASDTHVLRYDHGAGLLSRKRADDFARDLASLIDTHWAVAGPYDDVVLVGHSLGGVLVRSAYLQGLGSQRNQQTRMDWAAKVSRIVLLAAFNRGVHLKRRERFVLMFLPWQSLIRDLLIGSDFVTNLRLWWIRKLAPIENSLGLRNELPVVVQVRGTRDDRVDRSDSLDVEGFLRGHQLTVDATHGGLIKPNADGKIDEERLAAFRHAFFGVLPETECAQRKLCPKNIYFVVHGIRAANDNWVTDVSRCIRSQQTDAEIITPTYGRFSALEFAVPQLRRRKVRWFQDLYSLELAKNPQAKFYFVGHSYGTYLFGHAIRRLSGVEFERVSLNGSVLPSNWLWDSYRGQVKELRNARARLDFPVGILCSALNKYFMPDIGTAGYAGFNVPFSNTTETEFYFYKGGHSASVTGVGRKHIVDFILHGDMSMPDTMVQKSSLFSAFSAGAFLLLPAVVVLLLLLAVAAVMLLKLFPFRDILLASQAMLLYPVASLWHTFFFAVAVVVVLFVLVLLLI